VAEPTQHELGQWFTPEPVAALALALALRGASPEASVLDPSCGDGVFLEQAARMGIAASRLYGVDIDARAIALARARVPGATLMHGDFFDQRGASAEPGIRSVDVLVGNPPYVRQERLGRHAKGRIASALAADWPQLDRAELSALIGRSDLAAPFLLHALRHLRAGGSAALVISSAFLDSAYGAQFWKLLGQVASLSMLVDAPQERWFQDAAVNTMIAVFRATPPEGNVCLARLHTSTEEAARVVGQGGPLGEVAALRYAPFADSSQWAAGLRAPSEWFQFVEAAGDALTTLGAVAEIRRGVTSGANEIFYLRRDRARELELSDRFLQPLLKAPGKAGQGRLLVNDEQCAHCALVVPPETDLASHPSLRRYLDTFAGAEERRTLAARVPWWSLQVRPAQVFLSKAYAQRYVQPYSATPIVADQRIYCVHPAPEVKPALLSAILNSTATALALESLGRASMGEGALEWTVGDARNLPILDPRKLTRDADVLTAFAALGSREIGSALSEAEESDRQALDRSVLAKWPALLAMQSQLQGALVETCMARQRRAQA
jgi:hypothetical protein